MVTQWNSNTVSTNASTAREGRGVSMQSLHDGYNKTKDN